MPLGREDLVERCAVLAVPVADQEPEPAGTLAEVHGKVAGLLDDPGVVRVGGDPEQVDSAGGHLHHDQHVDPLEPDRVDVEEIDREQAVCLGAQERPPVGVHVPWCRAGSSGDQDAADRARADVMAQP
jgi:hypothetical protein